VEHTHLRLYDPAQRRILTLSIQGIKAVEGNKSGFQDIRASHGLNPSTEGKKRLSGDLTEIKNASAVNERPMKESYPHIRRALQQIEVLLASENIDLSPKLRSDFESAGQELALVAIQQPGRYLKTLSSLKALSQNELDGPEVRQALVEVRTSLSQLLPFEAASPQSSARTPHRLDDEFLENLEQLKRE
jgi:hypothetical protein